MADEHDKAEEESQVWQYQVRDEAGEIVNEWTTLSGADFKFPRAKKGETRWIKKGQKWVKLS